MVVGMDELIGVIDTYAPRELEEEWDNSGWQINLRQNDVKKILVALEITDKIIDEAIGLEVDFILTHHPLIFGALNVIDNKSVTGNYIIRLVKSNISVYSTHTNFDATLGGINDDLAQRIGLNKISQLQAYKPNGEQADVMGRLGEYETEKTLGQICEIIKDALQIKRKLPIVGDPNAKIKKVALCGGAGADAIGGLLDGQCDLFVTGDVKYHEAQLAKEGGLNLINAGHYATEKFFAENMTKKLRSQLGHKIEIIQSNIDVEPFELL